MKTTCEELVFIAFAGCRPKLLLKTNLSQVFLKGFTKLAYRPLLCGTVKDLLI